MLTRRQLLQLAITGAALVAAQPLVAHASPGPAPAVVNELTAASLAKFRRSRRALELFAILSVSPDGVSVDLLHAVLFSTLGHERAMQNLQMSAYVLRHTLGSRALVRYRLGAYALAPHIGDFESLRTELQTRFVWLALGQPGLTSPRRRAWIVRSLARDDVEGATRLVLATVYDRRPPAC
jgi:hypothetical protein